MGSNQHLRSFTAEEVAADFTRVVQAAAAGPVRVTAVGEPAVYVVQADDLPAHLLPQNREQEIRPFRSAYQALLEMEHECGDFDLDIPPRVIDPTRNPFPDEFPDLLDAYPGPKR